MADGDDFEEEQDEYLSEGIFYVPAGTRWSEIAAKAHTPEIDRVIDTAISTVISQCEIWTDNMTI